MKKSVDHPKIFFFDVELEYFTKRKNLKNYEKCFLFYRILLRLLSVLICILLIFEISKLLYSPFHLFFPPSVFTEFIAKAD